MRICYVPGVLYLMEREKAGGIDTYSRECLDVYLTSESIHSHNP